MNLEVRNYMYSFQVISKVATKLIAIHTYANVRGKYSFGGGFEWSKSSQDEIKVLANSRDERPYLVSRVAS